MEVRHALVHCTGFGFIRLIPLLVFAQIGLTVDQAYVGPELPFAIILYSTSAHTAMEVPLLEPRRCFPLIPSFSQHVP